MHSENNFSCEWEHSGQKPLTHETNFFLGPEKEKTKAIKHQ